MSRNFYQKLNITFLVFLFLFSAKAFALDGLKDAGAPLYPGFPRCAESRAYQQFQKRPMTELSKLVYMCDRLFDSNVEVLFEDQYYSAKFAAGVSRIFVAAHYRQEKAEDWIKRWGSTSPSGKPVWVKLPDGSFKLAKDVLLAELKELNQLGGGKK
ncbi:MAG: hypothetical protein A3G33_09895 [Omnitrophica bacterium RIFCSPLOWO2_12_FULL_44_17]|uniref:Uncharacterized protein n=1 Tax=Candidatus Danuiimicrobium aquiferis TaxID=1801832 RepID=A0A1G1L1U3_9BACT|nr:MAG: hypothetical protein A3B72_11165 [Omnitrophica bacterium RIFCSPHIGHO2_02_FULL_45_28]OGW98859.1 MAG: hypothetical protein A3G33_09895 [Omnitrophica bacterium RIFCSPLOWO2_12_FULL_44_17]OGX04106.1 MAG: hypothetical protein A3J12_02260 [Omnitrophica bacterium RIFCSPLOWO2_02_FULL_44_11]